MSEPTDSGDKPTDDLDVPNVVYWRCTREDRELLARVKDMAKVNNTADLLRFCVGAAIRELARAGEPTGGGR
jgi:hypothetical protein